MKKWLVLVTLTSLSVPAFAAKPLTFKEYKGLTVQGQAEVLEAYKEFVKDFESSQLTEEEKTSFLRNFSLFSNAYAEEAYFNCLYAGWPSKLISGKCTNPSRGNPGYTAVAEGSSCTAGQLMCQPLLFGYNVCADVSTRQGIQTAFAQCERKFTAANYTIEGLARGIVVEEADQAMTEMFNTVEGICTQQRFARTTMCTRVQSRVTQARSSHTDIIADITPGQPENLLPENMRPDRVSANGAIVPISRNSTALLRSVAQTTGQLGQIVNSANDIECNPERVVALDRQVQSRDENVPVIVCEDAPLASHEAAEKALAEDHSVMLNDWKVAVTPAPEHRSHEFSRFAYELKKVPAQLMRELADAGGSVRVVLADSVTRDPQFPREALVAALSANQLIKTQAGSTANPAQISPTFFALEPINNRTIANLPAVQANDSRLSRSDRRRLSRERREREREERRRQTALSEPLPPPPAPGSILAPPPPAAPEAASAATNAQNSASTILSTQARALDNMYGPATFSSLPQFNTAMNNPRVQHYLKKVLTAEQMSSHPNAFAEMFAYYYGCEQSKNQVKLHAPMLAAFFDELGTKRATDLNPTMASAWQARRIEVRNEATQAADNRRQRRRR